MATVRKVLAEAYGDNFANGSNSYLFEVSDSPRLPHVSIVITGATANDRWGYDDAVSVSNYRVLFDAWGHLDGFHSNAYMNCDSIALELDSEAPEDLLDVLSALADYPVLDESLWSEVEQEMIEEHWESYGRRDALEALATGLEVDYSDLTDNAVEAVNLVTFCGGDFGLDYPQFIDSSAVEFHTDAVVEFIIENRGQLVSARYGSLDIDLTALVESV